MGDEKRKPPMYYPQWCSEVKKALVDRDMKINELAGVLGYSRPHVTKAVNGRISASDDLVERISTFLGVRNPNSSL